MTTKDEIVNLADNLIRDKGYNGFSFKDISKSIGIKTSSIHYYFPFKSDLGVSVIKEQIKHFDKFKNDLADKSPKEKLEGFFQIYSQIKSDNKVCLVGSLATDFNTIEGNVKAELKKFAEQVLNWVTQFARENSLKFVRMDTWADNLKIIEYYKSFGFQFIENYQTTNAVELPIQNRNLNVALLQLELKDN